jgi:hypothetical protein
VSHVAYVVAGYGLSAGILAGYAAWLVTRERALARDLGVTSTRRRPSPTVPAE